VIALDRPMPPPRLPPPMLPTKRTQWVKFLQRLHALGPGRHQVIFTLVRPEDGPIDWSVTPLGKVER
jgi:hypothetical protein